MSKSIPRAIWMAAIVLALSTALLVGSPAASAQSIFASLSGTVTDQNGAAIAGAKVIVENESTKITRTLVTNSSGVFSMAQLPTGTYSVSVEAKGFEKWGGSGIILHAADDKSLSIPLKIGSESITVEVKEASGSLDLTDSGAVAHTIDSEQLGELALIGRNALEYLKILPGSALQANGGKNSGNDMYGVVGINGSTIGGGAGGLGSQSINGQAGLSVSINQDGQNVMDPGSIGNATPVNANPDMISELTVQSSNYGADNAKGPVVVNAITKSGGTEFHGDIRYSRRDTNMNSEDAFNKAEEAQNPTAYVKGQLKGKGVFSFPGFSVGGPVIIPRADKWKNKLFFHEFAENYRQTLDGGLTRAFVPTQAELNGDFSGAAAMTNNGANMPYGDYNWLGDNVGGKGDLSWTPQATAAVTAARSGCVITAAGTMNSACISPAAQMLLKDGIPVPTSTAMDVNGFNYVHDIQAHQNDLHNDIKLDTNFSDNTKAYVTWSHQSERAHSPMGLWTSAGDGNIPAPSSVLGKNSSDALTANLVQVFTPTLTMEARFGFMRDYLPGSPLDPKKVLRKDMGFPLTGVWGNATAPVTGSWSAGVPMVGDIGHDYHPDFYAEKTIPSVGVDVTKVYRTHTAKAGAFWENVNNAQDAWAQYMGFFDYGYWTTSPLSGNLWADELMGINVHYTEQAYVTPTKMTWNDASAYLTDHWKITPRLALDYGLRFEHYGVPVSDSPFGSMTFSASKYATQFTGGSKNPGLSYYGIDHSVPKSGGTTSAVIFSPRFGAAYDVFGNAKTTIRGGWGMFRYNWGWNQNAADAVKGSQYWTCNSSNGCVTWEDIDKHANTGGTSGTSSTCTAGSNCAPVVVQGVVGDLKSQDVGVIDPTNTDIPFTTTYSVNIDQQLPGKLKFEVSYVGSRTSLTQTSVNINPVPLGALTNPANISTINGTQQLTLCSGMDGGTLASQQTDSNCQQLFRKYTNYHNLNSYESAGKSRYDSFQTSLARSTGRTMLMLNYTWAKNLGNDGQVAGGYKDYGVKEYWSVVKLDRGQVLNASYVFRLDRGWEISGITQVESGAQLSANNGYNFGMQNTGQAAQLVGTPDITLAPVITCNPKANLKKGQFVNPDCFADPGQNGNGVGNGRTPYLAGPMYWNSDLTLTKKFSITERQNVELRATGINFLNHDLESFSNGDQNLKLSFDSNTHLLSNGNNSVSPVCPGPACTVFGYADYHRGYRILELSAKYSF